MRARYVRAERRNIEQNTSKLDRPEYEKHHRKRQHSSRMSWVRQNKPLENTRDKSDWIEPKRVVWYEWGRINTMNGAHVTIQIFSPLSSTSHLGPKSVDLRRWVGFCSILKFSLPNTLFTCSTNISSTPRAHKVRIRRGKVSWLYHIVCNRI